jgi:hypothetical protein
LLPADSLSKKYLRKFFRVKPVTTYTNLNPHKERVQVTVITSLCQILHKCVSLLLSHCYMHNNVHIIQTEAHDTYKSQNKEGSRSKALRD